MYTNIIVIVFIEIFQYEGSDAKGNLMIVSVTIMILYSNQWMISLVMMIQILLVDHQLKMSSKTLKKV